MNYWKQIRTAEDVDPFKEDIDLVSQLMKVMSSAPTYRTVPIKKIRVGWKALGKTFKSRHQAIVAIDEHLDK